MAENRSTEKENKAAEERTIKGPPQDYPGGNTSLQSGTSMSESCKLHTEPHLNRKHHKDGTNGQNISESLNDLKQTCSDQVQCSKDSDHEHPQNSTADEPTTDSGDSESSSSESEQETSSGYVLLPQDPDESECVDDIDDDGTCNCVDSTEGSSDVKDWHGVEAGASISVNTERTSYEDDRTDSVEPVSKLEDSDVKAIKQAMLGFSLPSSSTPDWARVVPEDVWKTKLIKGLQNTNSQRKK